MVLIKNRFFKILFISASFFLLNLSCKGCHQEPELEPNPSQTDAGSTDAKLEGLNIVSGRYWHLKGDVGGRPVTMDLLQSEIVSKQNDDGGNLVGCGSYYEDEFGQPASLYCKWGENGDLEISDGSGDDITFVFEGRFLPDGVFTGQKREGKKQKSQQFLLKENFDHGSVRLDLVSCQSETLLFKEVPLGPKAVISIELLSPQKGVDQNKADFLNKNFFRFAEPDSESPPVSLERNEFIKKTVAGFFNDYHENYADDDEASLKNEDGTYGIDLNYENIISDTVFYNENNLLSIGNFVFDYSGGAHGNYGTMLFVYDLLAGKMITLEDILDTESDTLKKALKKSAKKQLTDGQVSLDEILNSETLESTPNIAITQKGIIFDYIPYEIASFAQGEIKIFVPFEEIKEALKPEFKKRVGIF